MPWRACGDVERVGTLLVDAGMLAFTDLVGLDEWSNASLDGLADALFWGRDAAHVAAEVGAPRVTDVRFGWVDVPVDEAAAVARRVAPYASEVPRCSANNAFQVSRCHTPSSLV
jgi:hypothetical protein